MSDTPSGPLSEEPQEERGPVGSRDEGSPEPAGGPVDRPAGTSGADSDTAIDPQAPDNEESPHLPTGD
jgi:hypothetical protein